MEKTFLPTNSSDNKTWYLIDGENKTVGRVSSIISQILRGKHKPDFSYHLETGDNMIVINAEKLKLTGNKDLTKVYFKHTGRPGSKKTKSFKQLLEEIPGRILETSVAGMLPKTPLGRKLIRNLKVYRNSEHPHAAQQPIKIL